MSAFRLKVSVLAALSLLLTLPALASGGGYVLDWFTIDGGGGTSSGGGIVVEGAIGQPDAGQMSGGGITAVGGFYSEEDNAVAGPLFLPLVMRNYPPCFAGPGEVEPNNDFTQANGPLCPGTTDYTGYHNGATDDRDFFQFALTSSGTITVKLLSYVDTSPQITLYDQTGTTMIGFAGGPPYTITCPPGTGSCTGATGTYYVRVYTPAAYNPSTPYTLRVNITYP